MTAPLDTLDVAWSRHMDAFRAMPPEDRLQLALGMSEEIREIALAGIRSRHPAWTPAQVQDALEDLVLGTELARRARQHRTPGQG